MKGENNKKGKIRLKTSNKMSFKYYKLNQKCSIKT